MAGYAALEESWRLEEYVPMDLHTAASLGCEDRVREITQVMVDDSIINEKNIDGWSPLMFAAFCGSHRVICHLLDEKAQPSLRNAMGETALMLASKCGNRDAVAVLLEIWVDLEAVDARGWTAIFHAVFSGHRSVLQLLLEKRCEINIVDKKGFTPLMIAAEMGHQMVVKDLLQSGASTSVMTKSGETARSLAIKKGFIEVQQAIDKHLCSRQNNGCDLKNEADISQMNLAAIMKNLGLTKYYAVFEQNAIDLHTFWTLTDSDLKEMGIGLLGPRKRIMLFISGYQEEKSSSDPEDSTFCSQLTEKNEAMQQRIKVLTMLLSQEQKMRSDYEKRFYETHNVSKLLSEKIRRNVSSVMVLLQMLRETLNNHKNLLMNSIPETYNKKTTSSALNQTNMSFQFLESLLNEICAKIQSLRI